ncbi:hypothetical protein JCM18899A_13850 [Nocardioides sp. AN3]
MATKPVKVAFLADTADLRQSLARAQDSMEQAGQTAKSAGEKIDTAFESTAGHADDVASKGAQAAGALSGLGGLVGGQFGTAMTTGGIAMQAFADAGDLVNVVTESAIVKKIKDIAVTTAHRAATLASAAAQKTVAAATKVWAATQWALNAAMTANPIGIVIVAVAALAAAAVIAYKKSDTFRAIVEKAFTAVKAAASLLWAGIKLYFGLYVGAIQRVIAFSGSLVSKVKAGFNQVVSFVGGVPGRIIGMVGRFRDAGSRVMAGLIDGLKNIGGKIGSFAGAVGSAVTDAVRSSINRLLDAAESAINFAGNKINAAVPGSPVPHISLPHLAKGGIVTGPTLALIGEAGPEAVIPLNRGGFGNTYQITVVAPVGSSSAEIGRTLVGHISEFERSGGRKRAL